MYKLIVRRKAKQLRKEGKSLGEISKILGVAKSTASVWLKSEKCPEQIAKSKIWFDGIRKQAHSKLHELALKRQRERERKAEKFSSHFSFSKKVNIAMLAMLYWAEGSKGNDVLCFANTDPNLCVLFIKLLRSSFTISEEKLRIRLHLHSYHKETILKRYWSNLLQVPLSQFNKTFVKQEPTSGKRFRKNFHGICFIKYNSVAVQRQIMAYALSLSRNFRILRS